MSNQDQTPPSEGHKAPPAVEEPNKQAQGAEIKPATPEHDKKPETADGAVSAPPAGKPS